MTAGFSTLGLVRRGLRHHWRIHLSVALGAAVATSVLVGALLAGDSVTYSLRQFALMRLGRITHAMVARDRLFAAAWADSLAVDGATATAALLLDGVAIVQPPDGSAPTQINRVQVLGIDEAFWDLSPVDGPTLDDREVAINTRLADALGIKVGDELGLRIAQPTLMPRDAPLASRKEALSQRGSLRVAAIVPDDGLGRFGLQANQIAPYNAFVNRAWLQTLVKLDGRANLLLVAAPSPLSPDAAKTLDQRLADTWKPAYAGIAVTPHPDLHVAQLESDRVFIDPVTARAALAEDGVGVLSYLVNSLADADAPSNRTPYAFVNACAPSGDATLSPAPADMRDDEILLNAWTAERLATTVGGHCRLTYHQLDADGGFTETTRTFRVRGILAMDALRTERRLMPAFPGLTDVDTCREWDIGMPMDEEQLRDPANEAYWKAYGPTPKAIVTLAAGQAMWGNRFGNLSAVRYPIDRAAAPSVEQRVASAVSPSALGFFFLPIRDQAIQAVEQSLNLGEYFLGMSFFLIVAALMLTGLLFVFGIQRRGGEAGILLGIGWHPRHVAAVFLAEGAVVAGVGACLGAAAGIGYTWALIRGLATYWKDAVAGSAILFHVTPATLLGGLAAGIVAALVPLALAVRHVTRHSARELLYGDLTRDDGGMPGRVGLRLPIGAALGTAIAVALVAWATITHERHIAYVFFGAGALLLVAGMCLAGIAVRRLGARVARRLTVRAMGMRNAARRRGRSLAAVGLLACGTFMVVAVSSMQENIADHAHERWSGSGGFTLFAESTIPIPDPLDADRTRAFFGMARHPELTGIALVSIKVRDGDDASCFNLNKAAAPRLLGVRPADLIAQRAFADEDAVDALWSLLDLDLGDDTIPGLVGDSDTALWNLQKRTDPDRGETIAYTDERGRPFKVKLVGRLPMRLSVFQGTVLIARRDFAARFPSESGYRMFLAAAPRDRAEATRAAMNRCFERAGMDVTTSLQRLRDFYAVESTYLAMFLVLGGLGLLLGSVGMGIVVMRNVVERRGELAALLCLGFAPRDVQRMVMAEHWMLLLAGTAIGLAAASIAVWPNLRAPGVELPVVTVGVILAAILAAGIAWIGLAAHVATRGDLMAALRSE